jgi:chemotaxis protein CheD
VTASPRADQPAERIHVVQGECRATDDPKVVLATILGSCVSACMHDTAARVGGMNHFLLPDGADDSNGASLRYGAYAMELLVNRLLTLGARRDRLEAKLFGGARLIQGLTDIGMKNSAFAQRYLRREGIRFSGGNTGGTHARRIQFWPVSGRVRQLLLTRRQDQIPDAPTIQQSEKAEFGAVEYF